MSAPDKSIFAAIADFIPSGQKEEYWRFVAHVENLPKGDEILCCVQAMGVLAIIARQVPGEVAAQLKVLRVETENLLGAHRRESDRAARVLSDSLAKLTSCLNEVTTKEYIHDLTSESISRVEGYFKSILNRLPQEQMVDFTANFKATADWLIHLKHACESTNKKVEATTSQFDRELSKMLNLQQQLNVAIIDSVKTKISVEQARRQWPWMVVATTACLVLTVVCWSTGRWYQRVHDIENVQFVEIARRELEKTTNLKVVLEDTRDSLNLVVPLGRVDMNSTGTYDEGGRQTLHLAIRK